MSADYKRNGILPYFYTDPEDLLVKEGYQEPYSNLNASLSRDFFKHQLQVVAGVKNILNVTTSMRVGSSGGGAHSGGSGVPISYGRALFLSLKYKFYK